LLGALCLVGAPAAPGTNLGPEGKIAFFEDGDIWAVNPDGTGLTDLTKTQVIYEDSPAFSPDGNYIAYTRGNAELWIMRADGSEQHRVANINPGFDLAWSPDGTEIAFRRYGSGTNGISVINRDGSGLKSLISDDSIRTGPSWSPDGAKIAFSRAAPPVNSTEIWTMNADGTGATPITNSGAAATSAWPNWSPDGSKIVFSSDRDCVHCGTSDIYAVPSGGGGVARLTNLPGTVIADPVWSPDGSKIVFTRCVDSGTACPEDLYLMNADGSGLTSLRSTTSIERAPDWQPAAGPPLPPIPDYLDKIVFTSMRNEQGGSGTDDVFTMNPDGSGQRALTDSLAFEGDPAWSPDGSKIAFASNRAGNNYEIYVMNPDGTGLTNLTQTTDPNINERSPAWAPDGSRIAYRRDVGPSSPTHQIWVMNANGTGQTQITPGPSDYSPAWSPDGTTIAFSHSAGIYTMSPNGTNLAQLTAPQPNFDDAPAWSPDGSKIAFTRVDQSGSPSVRNIWVMNADGTAQHQLVSVAGGTWAPSWAPDGTKIAFARYADYPFDNKDVFVMNSDGTGQVDISNSIGGDDEPDWRRVSGYSRPKGASPMRISLVPAAVPCSAPSTKHGAPLEYGSCAPPALSSQYLTTGTPDANGRAARMNAYLLLRVKPGDPATPADEADVSITAHLNDVANKDLSDYEGELRGILPLRITDKGSPSPASVSAAATTQPFAFGFDIPCVGDPSPAVGSDCTLDTTVDALVPGAIKESLRTVWQIGQVRVFDGGADGDGSTAGDNTPFATEGLFIP
jgi:Tol biopolymer transport system component